MPKLLIVDDETDILEFAANFFRKRKVEVFTAPNGEQAVSMALSHKPNLVLMDIGMSGIDGIETLKRMKEMDCNTKVIMVTGREPQEDASFNKCMELGAMGYIHKPLELDELEKVVLKELMKI